VRGEGGLPEGPWTTVHADVCNHVVDEAAGGDTTSTSTPADTGGGSAGSAPAG
jgi:hypothetical protein